MVSQEFTEEPAASLLSQCLISGMYACPVPSEVLTFGLQRDGRNRNDSVQSDCVPSCSQPTEEQIFMPAGMVLQRGIKLPGMLSRCLMNCEVQKEIGHRHFSHEQGHGLSLTLGSHFPSDVLSSNHCEQNGLGAESRLCSGYVNTKGGSTKLCCQGVHKTLGDDPMVCEGGSTTCANSLNPSSPTSHHMEAMARALWNSPYLQPAQQLLDEVVCVSNAVETGSEKQLKRYVEMTMQNGVVSPLNQHESNEQGNNYSLEEKHEAHTRIAKLFQMLDELENQSERYFHQMDEVVSRFEVVAGTGAAASYTALTIQAMSKHFSNLRDAIVAQIHASRDALSGDLPRRNHECFTRERSPDQNSGQKKETLQRLGMTQYRHMLRPPLRGLPENSVAVLRTWLFEHFLHPYPNDNEKLLLASQTGLTRNQISNWFINARVRLWKPMIEAMYREELAEDSEPFCLN